MRKIRVLAVEIVSKHGVFAVGMDDDIRKNLFLPEDSLNLAGT